jgi:uncharacterized DUF497 family protein
VEFDDDFDKNKSEKTRQERGIDFIGAQAIWLDASRGNIPAKNVLGEVRFATVGKIGDKLWVALWTERESKIRIFSVHRAENTAFEKEYSNEIQKRD